MVCTPVKVLAASVLAKVALVVGNVMVVPSVPASVRVLLTVKVLPPATVTLVTPAELPITAQELPFQLMMIPPFGATTVLNMVKEEVPVLVIVICLLRTVFVGLGTVSV